MSKVRTQIGIAVLAVLGFIGTAAAQGRRDGRAAAQVTEGLAKAGRSSAWT